MTYKFINKIQIKYNPSVVEYSSRYQLFICGTYQLVDQNTDQISEETLKRVNNRLGNLLLISRSNQLVEEYECFDGGVFDIKVFDFDGGEDRIIVAHSNGFVAIYSIDLSDTRLKTIRRYSTNSSLLTCLEIINKELAVVGSSEGQILSIDLSDETTQQLSVTKFSEPIWTLFCRKLSNKYLLFVGSDDSFWRIYCFHDLSQELLTDLKPIHTNNDSKAGITSFGSDFSSDTELSLIVGSYDELIRFYSIEFLGKEVKVSLKQKLHIPESGIWRIMWRKAIKDTLLVSGMYSGAHIITESKVIQTLDPMDNKSDEKHLIYGSNCDSNMDKILISSFYGKNVYLFSKT